MPFLPPPKLYCDLAHWWPLVSPIEECRDEATACGTLFAGHSRPVRTVLELGCGGGNNAFFLKEQYDMTLVDISPQMLAICEQVNPGCRLVHADMRHVRLDRQFDAVFVHDAVDYVTTVTDLQLVADTAANHCKPGGVVLMVPDFIQETFREGEHHGGSDGADGRSVRYLEWVSDPDPADTTYITDYAYLFREADGSVSADHDRHTLGLFSRAVWLETFRQAGLEPKVVPLDYDQSGEPDVVAISGVRV